MTNEKTATNIIKKTILSVVKGITKSGWKIAKRANTIVGIVSGCNK